jgi:hypothetical protein
VTVGGYCTVKFDGGAHHHGSGGGKLLLVLNSTGRTGKNAHLIFTNGYRFPDTIFSEISHTGNGGRLTIDETCCPSASLDPTADPFVTALACDIFGPATVAGGGYAQNSRNRTVRRNSINPFRSNGQPTGAGGLTGTTVSVPPFVTLVEAWVKIPVGTGNASTVRCFIGNKDKSVVYGQTTAGAQNAGQYLRVDLQMLRVENVALTREVRFWFDNGAGGNTAALAAGLIYGGVVYE